MGIEEAEIRDYINDLFDGNIDETHILQMRNYPASEVTTSLNSGPILEILADKAASTQVYYDEFKDEIRQDLLSRYSDIYAEDAFGDIVATDR